MPRLTISYDVIHRVVPILTGPIEKYAQLQSIIERHPKVFHNMPEFRRVFRNLYKIHHRTDEWMDAFFPMFQTPCRSFLNLLTAFYQETGRVEGSFVSKVLATLEPQNPVIDANVLSCCRMRLPPYSWSPEKRIEAICKVYEDLRILYLGYLAGADSRWLTAAFARYHPKVTLSEFKMVDLVLWKRPHPTDYLKGV